MVSDPKVTSELSRELSLFHITMMGLGMMIGAGVFLGIGNAIYISGPGGVILTFVLNGVIAVMTACSYAELSSAIPHTGGAYNYTRVGFGRGISFISGWMEWFASSVAGSLYAVTFSIYVVRYLDMLGAISWIPGSLFVIEKCVAVLIALLFLYINYRGASETGKVGAVFTFGQTLFLVVIGFLGLWVMIKDPARLQNFQPFLPHGWSKLLVTMGFTYVAFEGFEVIAQAGDETIEPRKNLPKAMLYSVCIVTATYALVAFAAIVAVKAGSQGVDGAPWHWIGQFRERGFGEAVSRLIPAGNLLLTLAIIFASTSALNATIYSATRALYALGRDKMVPHAISKVSKKKKTPWVSLILTGLLVILVAAFLPTMDVASSASMMFILLFFIVNICVIRVRNQMGDELTYGFLMPFFPWLPIIAIICQCILAVWMHHMSRVAWIVAPAWVLTGVLIYHCYAKTRAVATAEEIQILEEESAASNRDYRVMVAVANPENALRMMTTTREICQIKKAQIELLHMVQVPEQIPLRDAQKYIWEGKEAIVEAMLYLMPRFDVGTTVRYCRNIARGIVSAVRDKKTDLLIVGWHGQECSREFHLGSTVDPIVERAACNVVILKGKPEKKLNRILVPVAGGINSAYALEMASVLASQSQAEITVLTVDTDHHTLDLDSFVQDNLNRLYLSENEIHLKRVHSSHVVDTIIKVSELFDLVVLGCTNRSYIYKATHATIPDLVARGCQKPVVMVKAQARVEGLIKRWF